MTGRPARLVLPLLLAGCASQPPADFVPLDQVLRLARYEVRYFSDDNFIGRPIDGYQAGRIWLTRAAAHALAAAEDELEPQGLRLKIFYGYRPQRAVEGFRRWAAEPHDTRMRGRYYPKLDKAELFRLSYLAERSAHSRGSTVDLTLVDAASGEELDMGSPFDFFGPIAHHDSPLLSPPQAHNRERLRNLMRRHGFRPCAQEWWHYTLEDEPYPNTCFDFPVR